MLSYNLNPEHLMKDVYSYPFPEVRQLLGRSALNPEFMLNTLDAAAAHDMLAPFNFEPSLQLPRRSDDSLDLDELHVPVIERIRSRVSPSLPGVETFEHAYPTHGSSQSIFNLLAEWQAQGSLQSLGVLKGEYEGYGSYAQSLRIPLAEYTTLADAKVQKGQVWFISNPSAVDGNWLDADMWQKFLAAGHQVVVDAAYVGLTPYGTLDVSSPNIRAVLTSPSKIFGVFRYRNTGITYTREPVASLYGTKWFKDVPALLDTLNLYETFKPNELPQKYRRVQEFICQQLVTVVGTDVLPSDVSLLANTQGPVNEQFTRFFRAKGYRFGLTKLFEDYERSNPLLGREA